MGTASDKSNRSLFKTEELFLNWIEPLELFREARRASSLDDKRNVKEIEISSFLPISMLSKLLLHIELANRNF